MKLFFTALLICLSIITKAQKVQGLVMSNTTKLPLPGAAVKLFGETTIADDNGAFSVVLGKTGNVLTVSNIGYKSYYYVADNIKPTDTIKIYLNPLIVNIDAVTINAHSYKMDSLRNRKDFKAVFDYQSLRFKDVIVSRSAAERSAKYQPRPERTSSVVSLDVLSVIRLLTKNRSKVSRLQKRLLKDEEENYADHRFSAQKVSEITKLQGDSLRSFLNKYRPGLVQTKAMTEYDLLGYIKKCYREFVNDKP